jgi:gluconate 2-dehydrogenase gamma chain
VAGTGDRLSPADGTRSPAPLSPAQWATLQAIGDRLIPADDHGPGAVQAGAIDYVGQALAGDDAHLQPAYVAGLEAVDARARGAHGRPFEQLAPEARDAILAQLEQGDDAPFFELVRRHVFEGMFGDPSYGGNRDGAGWRLLGYAGPRATWLEDEQRIERISAR